VDGLNVKMGEMGNLGKVGFGKGKSRKILVDILQGGHKIRSRKKKCKILKIIGY
jgi:hypothetical protein